LPSLHVHAWLLFAKNRNITFSGLARTSVKTTNPTLKALSSRAQAVTEVIMLKVSRLEAGASRQYLTGSAPRRWAVLTMVILVTPIIAAIWVHRWFVTQDGSIYLYNTHIILESLKSNNPFHDYYSVRWVPVPYWGAYLLLGALMSILPDRIADLIIISITSVGFLGCILWLRHRVAGWNGMALVAPFAVILSINLLWLLGFYNFLLGACCYAAALGVWWSGRDKPGPRRALLLAGLLIAGYFCHPVSSGLTAFALVVLSLATPGPEWRRRLAWTLTSVLPSVLLIYFYQSLMPIPAETHARWADLADRLSVREWLIYIRAADITPLAYAGPDLFFSHTISRWSHLPAVTTWSILGLILLSLSALLCRRTVKSAVDRKPGVAGTMRGWLLVSALFIFCGLFGPTDLGDIQGGYLRQRFLLLGFATAVPIFKAPGKPAGLESLVAKLGFGALLIGCVLQLAAVWDYAEASNRLAGDFVQAKRYVGTGQRVAVLVIEPEIDYEPRPLVHLGDLFGIGTGNVIWNNYAPALDYFPIRFRDATDRDLFYVRGIPDFEQQIAQEDLEYWEDLLSDIEGKTDVLVVWGRSDELDEINSEWFEDEPVFGNDNVRVFRHLSNP